MSKTPRKNRHWRQKPIRIEMVKRDFTQKDLADQIGVTPQTISYVIQGERTSRRVAEAICRLLELDYARLFGDGKFRQAS